LNGGGDIQELISDLYLDKQELERYLDYHYAGGIGLNFTGVRFGRRAKQPRRSAEHIFIVSSSDSSEDEEQGQNSSAKRQGKKKKTTKKREEQTVEIAKDQGSCAAAEACSEESNGHAGEAPRDHKGSVSDEGVGTFTGDTLTVESDEEDDEFEIVEDASTSSVLDEKKQKMQKILEILKQKAEDMSSDEFSSDEEQKKESSKTINSSDSDSDDCVITSVIDWPVDHAKYEKSIKSAGEIDCIVLDSDEDIEQPSTSGIQFKSSSKISLPPPKSS